GPCLVFCANRAAVPIHVHGATAHSPSPECVFLATWVIAFIHIWRSDGFAVAVGDGFGRNVDTLLSLLGCLRQLGFPWLDDGGRFDDLPVLAINRGLTGAKRLLHLLRGFLCNDFSL